MDMKSLMVKSIVDKKVLHCTRRLYFGKKCYVIKFEVQGKYMVVRNIKRVRSSSIIQDSNGRRTATCRHLRMLQYKRSIYNYQLLQLEKKNGNFCDLKSKWDRQSIDENFSSPSLELSNITSSQHSNATTFTCYRNQNIGDSCYSDDPYWPFTDGEMSPKSFKYPTTVSKSTQTYLNIKSMLFSIANGNQLSRRFISRNHIGTQTFSQCISIRHASQQTPGPYSLAPNLQHARTTLDKYQQTELLMKSQSVQCRCRLFHIGVQTKVSCRVNSSTQVWLDDVSSEHGASPRLCSKNDSSTYLKCASSPSKESNLPLSTNHATIEKEAVIYMLSEIGELVLNQNHMLSNNTRLLGQLSEMSMITKHLEVGRLWSMRRKYHTKGKFKRWSRCTLCRLRRCLVSTAAQTDMTFLKEVVKVHKATNTSLRRKKSLLSIVGRHLNR